MLFEKEQKTVFNTYTSAVLSGFNPENDNMHLACLCSGARSAVHYGNNS